MQKRNRTLRLFMVLILTISTITTGIMPMSVAAASFTDVPDDAYYAEAVDWAVDKGITKGTSDSTFSPEEGCTRAQCVTFLYRYAGSPEVDSDYISKFNDVISDEYYADAVAWAVEKKITTGTSDTTFSPGDKCTRAQIVTFLYRFAGSPKKEFAEIFKDVKKDDYCALSITWAVDKCITNGTDYDRFSPNNDCTRAHVVTFLYRYELNAVEKAWDGIPLLNLDGQELDETEILIRVGQEIPTIIEPWLGEDHYQDNDPVKLEESGQAVYAWAQKLKEAGIIRSCTYNSTGHTVGFFLPTGMAYVYMPDIRDAYSGAVNDYYTAQAFDELPVLHKASTWGQNAISSAILKFNVTRGSGGSASYIDSQMDEYDSEINGYQTINSLRTKLKSFNGKNSRVIFWRGHGNVYTDEDGTEVAAFCLRDKTWESDRKSNPTDYQVNEKQHPVVVTGTSLYGNLLETAATARFFEKYLPQVNGGLFFSGACYTGADLQTSGSGGSYMGNVVTSKGFDCYIAPDDSIWNVYSDGMMSLVSVIMCETDENDPFHRKKTLLDGFKEGIATLGNDDGNGTHFMYQENDQGPGVNFRLLPTWEEEYEKIILEKTESWGSVVQLADLDADNIPELLFGSYPGSGIFSEITSAYTFKNNKATQLKTKEYGNFLSYNGLTAYKKDNVFRIEGTYTLRAGAGNYSSCISTYSISGTGLEMQTEFSRVVTGSATTGASKTTFYRGEQELSSESAYDNEIRSWRRGWSELDKYPDVSTMWRKKPSINEVREFIRSYNEA